MGDRSPDRAPREPAPIEARLGLEWELWVVEKLSAGAGRDAVIDALAGEALDRARAAEQVDAILRSPSFARLARRAARTAMAESILLARRTLREASASASIESVDTIDRARFRREHWEPSRPLHLTSAARSMRAVREWTLESLAHAHGDVEVEVNVRRDEATRRALTERETARVRLADFLGAIARERTNERYIVSRNGLFSRPELAPLWDDLAPLPDILAPPSPPRGASLWVGPAGTLSPAHFDPHNVLLVQVQGRKRVRLVAPDHTSMFEGLDGYYAGVDLGELAARRAESVLEIVLGPGEALFVPVGFFHEIEALDPSITLSMLCFPWPNDFHWMQPISAATLGR